MQMRSKAAHLSGHIVVAKARELADELGIEDFVGSQGWLHGFKMRHSIKYWNLHGEASAADNSGVTFAKRGCRNSSRNGSVTPATRGVSYKFS